MTTYYYKWTNKKTGAIILVNFGYAESFKAIKTRDESSVIRCEEIARDEFKRLKAQGL